MRCGSRAASRRALVGWALVAALGGAPLAAEPPALAPDERLLLIEALRLAEELGEEIWSGWREAPFEVLLVGEEQEFLVNSPRLPEGFELLGRDEVLGRLAARARTVPPDLRATYPILGGPPVVVLGRPDATGLDPAAWIAVLLHEHFHQLQMADPTYYDDAAGLDLAGDDDSGQWMLDFPFPYDDPEVGRRFTALCAAIRAALEGTVPAARVVAAMAGLQAVLEPPAHRYLEFQLWQEGVARFVEYRTATLAAERFEPAPALRSLPGYRPFAEVATKLRERILTALAEPRLAETRRVAFYAAGAGLAMLLDREAPDWRARYLERKFVLEEHLGR